MALKVLLADDSAAIKKVVQLSLQDYGAEVKSVSSGKDVLDVCRSFNPDIAFVDVLLPHKTGYEVVAEMKKDAALKQTPVVMLWSAFMAFDEGKFKASGADEKLEKPFEVSGLRSLVTKLVPKMQANPVAKHLDFPKVDFDLPIGAVPPQKKPAIPPPIPKPAVSTKEGQAKEASGKEEWSMASFEDINQFTGQMKELQANESSVDKAASSQASFGDENQWVRKDLTSKFKVALPNESDDENTVSFQYTENEINDTSFLFKPQAETTPNPEQPQTPPQPSTPPLEGTATEVLISKPENTTSSADTFMIPKATTLTDEDRAQIQQQTREVVERVVWKLVPEIASQIIREEIQRLLGEEK